MTELQQKNGQISDKNIEVTVQIWAILMEKVAKLQRKMTNFSGKIMELQQKIQKNSGVAAENGQK